MKVLDRSRLLVTLTVLGVGGCASTPPPPSSYQSSSMKEGVPGGMTVDIATTTATVTDIDPTTRGLTLLQSDGSKVSFVAGPEVRNFDQIKVGDHVKASVTNKLELFVEGPGASSDAAGGAVATAAGGDKPGIVTVKTGQITAKIVNLDKTGRTVTVQFENGTMAKYPVRADIDLTKIKFNDRVVMRGTVIRSIVVETPAE